MEKNRGVGVILRRWIRGITINTVATRLPYYYDNIYNESIMFGYFTKLFTFSKKNYITMKFPAIKKIKWPLPPMLSFYLN